MRNFFLEKICSNIIVSFSPYNFICTQTNKTCRVYLTTQYIDISPKNIPKLAKQKSN